MLSEHNAMVFACTLYIVHGRYHALYPFTCSERGDHWHPFKKDSPHSHTTVEFQLIHLLNHVVTTGAGLFFLSLQFIACLLYTLSWRPERAGYHSSVTGVVSLRAPPSAV